jgi:hypothetical protein
MRREQLSYQDAVSIMPPEDKFKATVYAMNALLQEKGIYTQNEFGGHFMEWTKKAYGGPITQVATIANMVAEEYRLPVEDLIRKCNKPQFAQPRQVCMYLANALTDLSYSQISRYFKKHHSTVFHSIAMVQARRQADAKLNQILKRVSDKFADIQERNSPLSTES